MTRAQTADWAAVASFAYSTAVLERFPAVVGGVLAARGVTSGPSPEPLAAAFRDEQRRALERLADRPLAAVEPLAAWRRAFSAFGVEPTRYRSAAEALLRRLTKHGEIPSLNRLVDAGNLVSIRYALPVAVLDLAAVDGGIDVRFARGDEPFRDLGGGGATEHPEPGEVVFVDEAATVHARRWCWRQSAQSATGPQTRAVLVTVEAQHAGGERDVAAAVADLGALLETYGDPKALDAAMVSSETPGATLAV